MSNNDMIGKKFVLWLLGEKPRVYKDQFGFWHGAMVVCDEVIVTVTKSQEPPQAFCAGTELGLKAHSEDGRVFTRNWKHYPDDSMYPTVYWDQFGQVSRVGNKKWCDGVLATRLNPQYMPIITLEGKRAIPEWHTTCEEHDVVHRTEEQCDLCGLKAKLA